MRNKIIGLFVFMILAACNSNTLVSESKSLPESWNKEEILQFTIPQLDSLKQYNIFLHIRNNNDYKYSNLFLIVAMRFPHGKKVVDTLEYKMANPDGTWLGQGIGTIKESKLFYKENVSFPESGAYQLTIMQAMRNNGDVDGVTDLEGITDVGYSIEETPQ